MNRRAVTTERLEWERALGETGELTPGIVERVLSVHGDRGAKAIDAVHEGRVKEYRDFIVVVGHGDEYVVEGRACTCLDAQYNLDPDDPTDRCWHALAATISAAIGETDRFDLWYSDMRDLME